MKILYFAFVELDIPVAGQTHTLGILSGFGNNGCKTDAVIPRPRDVKPNLPGVHFFYIWPWRFSPLGNLWVKCLGSLLFFTLCFLKNYDAIYVRELESNPFPRWCANLFRIPYYIEVNGLYLLNKKVNRTSRNHLRRIERHQKLDFRCAEGLIVPSFPRSRWIIEHYNLESDKVYPILNGAIIPVIKKLNRKIALQKFNLPEDGFYLGFLGAVWKQYDLLSIIKAMSLCQTQLPILNLIIIGGGPELPYLKQIALHEGLSAKILDFGYIQPNYLYEAMGAIDVALMNLTAEGLKDLGPVTTRFATYAAFQIPVIANNLYIENYSKELVQGLYTIPHEDPNALADKILQLYKNPKDREEKARILYKFVSEKMTWNAVSKNILEIIRNNIKLL